MFHAIAERQVRRMFASLSAGDYEPAFAGLAPRFEHVFAGDHALGGTRRTEVAFRAWFERLYRLFPNLDFEVRSVSVSGPPWDLVVVAEWIDRAAPAGGGTYENHGAHVIRIVRGRLASLHAYLDTQVLAQTLAEMAANGVDEASAPPIVDAPMPTLARLPTRRGQVINAGALGGFVRGDTPATGGSSLGAVAIGALATGALAIGAVAIGRLAVGRLSVARARVKRLEIDELVIGQVVNAPSTALHPHGAEMSS